jgi:ATP-dependent RNA helicase DeaD
VADKRVAAFRQQVSEVLESEDLGFFLDVIAAIEEKHDADVHEIAAALAFLAQKDRPLQMPDTGRPDIAQLAAGGKPERPAREPRDNRSEILERRRDYAEGRLARYRIDVGREHMASPKDIVGAIANEAGIESRFIGQINLFEDYSTVELPADLPNDVLQILRRARVRQQPEHPPRQPRRGQPRARRPWCAAQEALPQGRRLRQARWRLQGPQAQALSGLRACFSPGPGHRRSAPAQPGSGRRWPCPLLHA